MKLTLKEKFLSRVRHDANGCWLWTGYCNEGGYGMMFFAGRMRGAHRVSWLLFRGRIPARKVVCHTCDVPPCVNPDHLFLGPHADNAADKMRKSRCRSGETNNQCKLTTQAVLEIRALLAEDRLYMTEIARLYGVSPPTVRNIKIGKCWRHVSGPAPATPSPVGPVPP